MNQETITQNTVLRGNRKYLEIEGMNRRYAKVIENLKKSAYPEISKANTAILLEYLTDMEKGRYTPKSSVKGGRSFKRLTKLFYILKRLFEFCNKDNILAITEKELHAVFDKLNSDKFRREDGKPYKDKSDFKRDFSAFWHWHMIKTFKTKETRIEDICEYITTPKQSKPKFCYFTFEELKTKIIQKSKSIDLQTALMILFDCGARPSEFYNLRLVDIKRTKEGRNQILISEEISKTYERTVTLTLTSTMLDDFLERNKFKKEDLLFIKYKDRIKKFLQKIGKMEDIKAIMEKTDVDHITCYDFRHSSACYYINVYRENLTARMKYRFGWKKESEIEYYTNFLGKQDVITEEELLNPEDKSKLQEQNIALQKSLEQVKVEAAAQEAQVKSMEENMKAMESRMQAQMAEMMAKIVNQGYADLQKKAVEVAEKEIGGK